MDEFGGYFVPDHVVLGEAVEEKKWWPLSIADAGDGDVVADGDAERFIVRIKRRYLLHRFLRVPYTYFTRQIVCFLARC